MWSQQAATGPEQGYERDREVIPKSWPVRKRTRKLAMRSIALLYWYWVIAGGLLGFGILSLGVGGWPFLLAGLGMAVLGRLFRLSIH